MFEDTDYTEIDGSIDNKQALPASRIQDRIVTIDGQKISYLSAGNRQNPCILLLMGMGAQAIVWPENLILSLAKAGYYVIAPDNRDVGHSMKLHDHPRSASLTSWLRYQLGFPVEAAYTLEDMAADHWRLLNHLKISKLSIVGASMGGMIAQCMALEAPHRVKHLSLLMTSSGNPKYMRPGLQIIRAMLNTLRTADNVVETKLKFIKAICGNSPYSSDQELLDRIQRCEQRSNYDQAHGRHLAAIFASGSRAKQLKKMNIPTLVVHGDQDPLIPLEAGLELSRLIRNSELRIIAGLGHDISKRVSPEISKAIIGLCRQTPKHLQIVMKRPKLIAPALNNT